VHHSYNNYLQTRRQSLSLYHCYNNYLQTRRQSLSLYHCYNNYLQTRRQSLSLYHCYNNYLQTRRQSLSLYHCYNNYLQTRRQSLSLYHCCNNYLQTRRQSLSCTITPTDECPSRCIGARWTWTSEQRGAAEASNRVVSVWQCSEAARTQMTVWRVHARVRACARTTWFLTPVLPRRWATGRSGWRPAAPASRTSSPVSRWCA
jgi:hypothetical protein